MLTRRVEDGQNRIAELAAKNDELIAELESKSNKNKQRKAELGEMKAQLSQRQAEQERQSRMKERVEKELQELKDKLEAKNKDAANLSTTIKDQEAKVNSHTHTYQRVCDDTTRHGDSLDATLPLLARLRSRSLSCARRAPRWKSTCATLTRCTPTRRS